MPSCVVDTNVLHHANRRIANGQSAKLRKRIALLTESVAGRVTLLISKALMNDYSQHLRPPFNDFVQAFWDAATRPAPNVRRNWRKLSGAERDRARWTCRFPQHDLFLLRTAYGEESVIYSEEQALVATDGCIHKFFKVHVRDPSA